MINVMSTIINHDKSEKYCNRARVNTGTHCNYKCWFCYYHDKLDEKKSLEDIKIQIDYLVECGIKEVDLSGGESSIHENWFGILDYCKLKGLSVSTLSNGYKFANRSFIYESQQHGLEEILFSLHGYDEESHNKIVGNPNGYRHIIQSIHNANEFGLKVRINCVVTNDNYTKLSTNYVNLIHSLDVFEVNFLTLNLWENSDVESKVILYEEISGYIKQSIDRLNVQHVNVRYIPYCYMVGYEKHVCDVYQHIYDVYDWNMAVYNGHIAPHDYRGGELECLYIEARKDRITHYVKHSKCLDCKYYFICDGLENKIKHQDVHPQEGERIRDVNHYRKGFYED